MYIDISQSHGFSDSTHRTCLKVIIRPWKIIIRSCCVALKTSRRKTNYWMIDGTPWIIYRETDYYRSVRRIVYSSSCRSLDTCIVTPTHLHIQNSQSTDKPNSSPRRKRRQFPPKIGIIPKQWHSDSGSGRCFVGRRFFLYPQTVHLQMRSS